MLNHCMYMTPLNKKISKKYSYLDEIEKWWAGNCLALCSVT